MIERGEGIYLIDEEEKRYIDGVSSLWCTVHGHGHPAIDAAVAAQLQKVAHTTMLGLSHPAAAELAARLVDLTPPGLSRVFYSESGSTATEIALKMAFQYQQQRGGQHARRTSFVHLRDSYHGDTIGSVSVGGIDLFHSTYRPLLFSTHAAEPGDAADLERVLAVHEEEIAAVIVEPLVQGAAGMLTHPPGYLRAVRELCDRFGVLLICDEVATGFGRTGKMFACEQEGSPPICSASPRGSPAATCRWPRRWRPSESTSLPRRPGGVPHLLPRPHLHGQPPGLRRRARQPRRLRARADDRGAAAEDRAAWELLAEVESMPEVTEVRGRGAMVGIDLGEHDPSLRLGHQVTLEARKRGAIIRPLSDVVVLMPPLSISEDELRSLVEITQESIRALAPRSSRLSWPKPPDLSVTDRGPARSKGVSETLVAAAADAPREEDLAFDQLYRSSRDDVYAYAAGLLRDRATAEDVTATAFERAYRKRLRFDPSRGNGRAWLFGIARNAALDELRRRGRQAELASEPIDASNVDAERSEQRLVLIAALEKLDPRERELVALKFFAGLANTEIAAVLKISESNAGTKPHRAITKLREVCDGAL